MAIKTTWQQELAHFLTDWAGELTFLQPSEKTVIWQIPNKNLAIWAVSLGENSTDLLKQNTDGQPRIIVWEDVWHSKKAVVQSRLRAVLGYTHRIPARLTRAQRIDKPTLDDFLQKNHLQITTNAKYKYGLFLPEKHFSKVKYEITNNNEAHSLNFLTSNSALQTARAAPLNLLVAAASFSGGKTIVREGQNYRSFELIRFCSLCDFTVVGGLDKLLQAFIYEHHPDDIMTYADRDWSDGASYEKLGFERIETTDSQQFWVNPHTYDRHYADRLTAAEIAPDWVEIENTGSWKFLKKMK
ncbi:MAG: hypothetical protein MUE30_04800 [Spirosomaceae bacterium]|nr:hypothetical protein [Spirosomataceae bacterium]